MGTIGTELLETKRDERGRRITEVLKQGLYSPMSLEKQVMILFAAINGYLDDVAVDKLSAFEADMHKFMDVNHSAIGKAIAQEKDISAATDAALRAAITAFKQGRK